MKAKTVLEEPPKKSGRIPPAVTAGIEETTAKGARETQLGITGEIHPLPLEEVISRIEERLDDC